MELQSAIKLIEHGVVKDEKQSWADLGAGGGLFTKALITLLKKGSSVTAIDKNISRIDVPGVVSMKADFLDVDFENTDGIIMANSLHYVKDQALFISKLSAKTKRLILVEYNTDRGNQWVPYPISFNTLKSLFPEAKLIGTQSSEYHREGMYAALIIF